MDPGTAILIAQGSNTLLQLLASLFQGNNELDEESAQEMMEILENLGMEQPYQSPLLEQLDPAVASAVLQNYSQYANWGWPGGSGGGIDTSLLDELASKLLGEGRTGYNRDKTPSGKIFKGTFQRG